ncbi:hypothetical protein L1987_08735 [Smallanthus sonchifolius]|uniref:Uncharacterized protein n=1 Tax=Smallanthus sonchifolius TaxID=185202 RepID=A0ACB9JN96_9ASTR|nr:hypothetical protein L1987_08735 [Smallanthus sonchifolius]
MYPKRFKSATDQTSEFGEQNILSPYKELHIYYSRKNISSYILSSLMMDYVLHLNYNLADNFYFKRNAPNFHPYILRLYGIVFWIQCLRAGHNVAALNPTDHEFLFRFLDAYPVESLPIVGPLIPLAFIRDHVTSCTLPNVPGILALLEHLNSVINAAQPTYPKLGAHTPVAANATVFGQHSFPASVTRGPKDCWSLVSSGLQYPCEADAKLNESFAERYSIKNVAASAAAYFEGSGTLADCPAHGITSNHIIVHIQTPATLPTAPTCLADKASLFPFAFRLSSTARALPPLFEAMAAMAQTNIKMFETHPYLSNHGRTTLTGDFWNIRLVEHSVSDYSSYLAISDIVNKMMKGKN